MGVAAYNRGSKKISAHIDLERPSWEAILLADLTELSLAEAQETIFTPTVLRSRGARSWVVMNREDDGWSSYGVEFPSLWAIAARFRLVFLEFGEDDTSSFVRVTPAD